MHCVDLGESFQTQILLQNLASIQPRTSPAKFARAPGQRPQKEIPFKARMLGDAANDDVKQSKVRIGASLAPQFKFPKSLGNLGIGI